MRDFSHLGGVLESPKSHPVNPFGWGGRKAAQTAAIAESKESPMSPSETRAPPAEGLFFAPAGLESRQAARIVAEALSGCDDGELFLEARRHEAVGLDDGVVKTASYGSGYGFGLRAVAGEATGYAHAEGFDEAALRRAASSVAAVRAGRGGSLALPPPPPNRRLYGAFDPVEETPSPIRWRF
jgi:TldD protein